MSWDAIFVHAGTQRPIASKLNKAFVAALSPPEVRECLTQLSTTAVTSAREGLAWQVSDEIPKAVKIACKTGAKVD